MVKKPNTSLGDAMIRDYIMEQPETLAYVKKEVRKKENELSNIKEKVLIAKASNFIKKLKLPSKLPDRRIVRKEQAQVKVSAPDYNLMRKMDRDKSRYFKTAWEEEKKQLFFK